MVETSGLYPNKQTFLCAQQLVEHVMWLMIALIHSTQTHTMTSAPLGKLSYE